VVPKEQAMREKWAGLRTLIMTGNRRYEGNGDEGWEYRKYAMPCRQRSRAQNLAKYDVLMNWP
jgi:hypothetical protein